LRMAEGTLGHAIVQIYERFLEQEHVTLSL